MNFKVNNSTSVKKSDKKSRAKATKAEGIGFATALEQAQTISEVDAPEFVAPSAGVESVGAVFLNADESSKGLVPENAKDRGYYILDLLEELEKDILSGNDTNVIVKLEEALKNQPKDIDKMPQVVKDLMAEIDMRASLELEKLKQS